MIERREKKMPSFLGEKNSSTKESVLFVKSASKEIFDVAMV